MKLDLSGFWSHSHSHRQCTVCQTEGEEDTLCKVHCPWKRNSEIMSQTQGHFESPQLSSTLVMDQAAVVLKNLSDNCDMTLERDLVRELGPVVDFKEECITRHQ